MSRTRVTETQEGFAGGVNTTADDLTVQPNQVRRLENAHLTTFGAAIKRNGTQRLHATALAGAVRGGFTWQQASGVSFLVMAGATLYVGVWSGSAIVWTPQATVFAGVAPVRFVSFRGGGADVVYFTCAGTLYKWTGSAVVALTITGNPALSTLAVYNQRLFAWTGTDETVYWSGLNDGDTLNDPLNALTPGGDAIVRTFSDRSLVGGAPIRGSLAMLHESGVSRFTGTTQADIDIAAGAEGITSDVGTTAPDSIVSLETALLFVADRGVYRVSEAGVEPVLGPIDDIVATLGSTSMAAIRAVHSRATREVWFFVPTVGVYAYNYRLNAWGGPWTGGYLAPGVSAMWEGVDASGKPIVLLGDAAGYVVRAQVAGSARDNVASDGSGGSLFTMRVRLRRFFVDGDALDKSLRWLYLLANLSGTSALTVTCATRTGTTTAVAPPGAPVKWGQAGTQWGQSTAKWGSVLTTMERSRLAISGRGEWLDVEISDTSQFADVTISRVEVEAFALARRG